MAVEKGGILDKTSELLDYALNLANNKNLNIEFQKQLHHFD